MEAVLFVLLWLVGIFLGIQLVAAGYGIVDYQYKWERYAGKVLMTIVSWSVVTWLVFALLSPALQIPLLQGIKLVVSLHILGVLLSLVVMKRFRLSTEKNNSLFFESLNAEKQPG